jgi:hypothetical protein
MARLISNPPLWQLHQAEGRAGAIREWAQANGLDPHEVSVDHDIVIDELPDGPVIRCWVFARNELGNKYATADGSPGVEERAVPLVVEPPDGWPVYAVPGKARP